MLCPLLPTPAHAPAPGWQQQWAPPRTQRRARRWGRPSRAPPGPAPRRSRKVRCYPVAWPARASPRAAARRACRAQGGRRGGSGGGGKGSHCESRKRVGGAICKLEGERARPPAHLMLMICPSLINVGPRRSRFCTASRACSAGGRGGGAQGAVKGRQRRERSLAMEPRLRQTGLTPHCSSSRQVCLTSAAWVSASRRRP